MIKINGLLYGVIIPKARIIVGQVENNRISNKGTVMIPLLVLVCSSYRENVIVACKIVSFSCSLDSFLLKMHFFSFWKSNFKMALTWKKGYFDILFTFIIHQRKDTNNFSAHLSLTYIHVFCSPYIDFFALPILLKLRIYHVWFLFGATLGIDPYSRHFGAINI